MSERVIYRNAEYLKTKTLRFGRFFRFNRPQGDEGRQARQQDFECGGALRILTRKIYSDPPQKSQIGGAPEVQVGR